MLHVELCSCGVVSGGQRSPDPLCPVHPRCPDCNGRGYQVSGVAPIPSEGYETGSFEPEECERCGGTGDPSCLAADPPRDQFDPIPWFTEKDAQQALERMHAWASTSDPLMRLVWDLLDDTQRGNLARVAFELRPR